MNPFSEDDRADSPTWLYRYYDADGDLLYVGISNEPKVRMIKHVRTAWFRDAVAIFYECYPLRRLAEAAEQMAIRIEDPLHNVVRRYCDHLSAHDVDWYFDLTENSLVGQGRFWAIPLDFNLNQIDRPQPLEEPAPIMPRITNRNRA